MATLYVFNPEHDLALASDLANFTAPRAGRRLRSDLGYLPALWAGPDDFVLVEDIGYARQAFQELMHRPFHNFVEISQLAVLGIDQVKPWGWDRAVRSFLVRHGVALDKMPSDHVLGAIRQWSSRQTAVTLLKDLRMGGTVGESVMVETVADVMERIGSWGKVVLKAPWSSSGRGVRMVGPEVSESLRGWMRHVLERQGAIIVEPYYNKVEDFAMEFEYGEQAKVAYRGLSLFHTVKGTYAGNAIAREEEKIKKITRYVTEGLIGSVKQGIQSFFEAIPDWEYQGPFGVDMMIVRGVGLNEFLLHPCVEVNLRRTMGHVSLHLPLPPDGQTRVMSISFDRTNYKLTVQEE